MVPQAILVSDWLISKKIFSETALPNESKLGRMHPTNQKQESPVAAMFVNRSVIN
jgi:hypothetical protein